MHTPDSVPVIETPRLILRPIAPSDADAYFALYQDRDVMRTYGTVPHSDIAQTHALIALLDANLKAGTSVRWGISLKDDPTLIGDVGFWRFVKERSRAEPGAKLSRPFWSTGLMTEALAAATTFGFSQMGLHSLEAHVEPQNRAAHRMVEKLGFIREGYLRKHSYCPWREAYVDTVLYCLLDEDWLKSQGSC